MSNLHLSLASKPDENNNLNLPIIGILSGRMQLCQVAKVVRNISEGYAIIEMLLLL